MTSNAGPRNSGARPKRRDNVFFSKNGAGTELPVKVTGTKSALHFGSDSGHKEDDRGKNAEHSRRNSRARELIARNISCRSLQTAPRRPVTKFITRTTKATKSKRWI